MENRIREKIEKLLRLSESNCNIHESILAAKMASEIARRYGVQIEEKYSFENEIIDFMAEYYSPFWKNPERWETILAMKVAENNACRILQVHEEQETLLNIIGRRKNVNMALYLLSWLHRRISMAILDIAQESAEWKHAALLGAAHGADLPPKEVELFQIDKFINRLNVGPASVEITSENADGFIAGLNMGFTIGKEKING